MNLNTIKNLTSKNYMNVFSRRNVCFVKGEGNTLTDTNGKEYIDFVAGIGVNTLGYNHPSLVSAITSQAQTLIHSSNLFYNRTDYGICFLFCLPFQASSYKHEYSPLLRRLQNIRYG